MSKKLPRLRVAPSIVTWRAFQPSVRENHSPGSPQIFMTRRAPVRFRCTVTPAAYRALGHPALPTPPYSIVMTGQAIDNVVMAMLSNMNVKRSHRAARTRDALVEAAARILAEQGPSALTVRKLAEAVGASTMSVYTHFGSMDEVVQEVVRASTLNLHRLLERAPRTDDPVADLASLGRIYRGAALRRPHIFAAASSKALLGKAIQQGDSSAVAEPRGFTWRTLVDAVQACVDARRYHSTQDSELCAYFHWSAVHGFVTLELSAMTLITDNPALPFEQVLENLAVGSGDDRDRAAASIAASRKTFTEWDSPLSSQDD